MSYVKIKYDRHGAVKKITGNIGQTRMNLAAQELWKGNIEPTFGMKFRHAVKSFFHNLLKAVKIINTIIREEAEKASAYITDEPRADIIPFIGIDEHITID